MIITASSPSETHRDLLLSLARQLRLPTVSPFRYYASSGGLVSYGPDTNDGYERAATYVDRILKGAAPGDLPAQAPVKFEIAFNVKTAKELGLEIPPDLLALADEVVE